MSVKYDMYLAEHKHNVIKGLKWLKTNLPNVLNKCEEELIQKVCKEHDSSKYELDEYEAYDKYFYGNNKSYSVITDFNIAWLKHIHRNPHHWQHWILVNDEPGEGIKALEMPYQYIIEMICDWWSFSWSKNDLTEIFNWYEDHKDNMILHEKTRHIVADILNQIKNKLETKEE